MRSLTPEIMHTITEHGHNGCECKLCVRNRAFIIHLACIPEDERPFFDNLYDHLMNVEFDLNYHEVVLSGDWPSAVEILERALVRAKQKLAIQEAKPLS